MRSTEALGLIRERMAPCFTTREAAAVLGQSAASASDTLDRLSKDGLIKLVRRGHWAADPKITPLAYAAWTTSPLPAYVSLYTALYHRGLIQQIPRAVYVVSLGRTETIETAIGTYSVHQIAPPLFGGYDDRDGILMATPEKAVFDTLYMGRATSGKFAGMTEIDLPRGFSAQRLSSYVGLVSDAASRKRVADAVAAFLSANKVS